MEFSQGTLRVRVPATSANLGPGFDSLGLALDLYDELEAEVIDSGLVVEVSGAGAELVPRDEAHLVVRAMRRAFDVLGGQPPGLRLSCTNAIPHSRGLGSSSAAIVAGLWLARGLVVQGGTELSDDALLQIAADIEGHPDNVAPAVHGGFVIAGQRDDDTWYAESVDVDPRVCAVAFIPSDAVPTKVARGLLPATVPHGVAAANSGRAALLVAALAGRPDLLLTATRDFLHQDQRQPAMPATLALVHALRADGHAAVVSGAGPTVLVLTERDAVADLLGRCPAGWSVERLDVDHAGCHVV